MYVACSTLCFAKYPLDRALRLIGELEFHKVDVAIHAEGPHLRPVDVSADILCASQKLRIGPSLSPAAISAEIDALEEVEFRRQFQAICRLARSCNVAVVTLPAAASGTVLAEEAERLKKLVPIAAVEGVIVSVETRIGTLTEYPDAAVELCERVPTLGLTLDPSHYIAGPHQGKSYDQVYPFVRHVHLRDTGRGDGHFQVRVGQGEIEYGRIVAQLVRHRYDRLLTVEINDIPDAPYSMEHEVRKLKYLLESLV